MINEKEITTISKFLSMVLQHIPELMGIELDTNGRKEIDILNRKSNSKALSNLSVFGVVKNWMTFAQVVSLVSLMLSLLRSFEVSVTKVIPGIKYFSPFSVAVCNTAILLFKNKIGRNNLQAE